MDFLLLASLTLGLMILLVTGFSAAVPQWFYPAVLGMCAGAVLVYRSRLCARFWPAVMLVLLLAYLLILYLNQDTFLRGMRRFGSLISYQMQVEYASENLPPFPGSGGMDAAVFLLLVCAPGTFWLGMSLLVTNRFLAANLLIFPLLAMLALCGAANNTAALFLILFGVVLGMAFCRPKKQRRMWGGAKKELLEENKKRFQSIQKKTALLVLAGCIAVSVPGFLVVRPLLAISLKPAEDYSVQLQSAVLNRVMKLLPELTAGQWNLNLEAIGGGVQNGALNSGEGYLLEGVEDLRLTLDYKPEEPIFLKGFVGKSYQDGSWIMGSGTTFDGAAMNWNTEGSARIYIQNLPFLRTAFALADNGQDEKTAERMAGISAQPHQILVERLNANDDYTYVPYGVYLNDYYQVDSGDGAVKGQRDQEDRYYFFSRGDLGNVLETWNTLTTANVLDRVEESYRAFCQTDCLLYPEDWEFLSEQVREAKTQNKWRSQENIDEISSWIRHYLTENYDYQLIPPEVPEGRDALDYFLTESKSGNSIHFASAAVILYRMFGVPARYVVGYEVPAALFTVQANGIYTATIQGDNSQAWAEIYEPGIGWMPRDMTPGVIGTFEEIGPGGEKVEAIIPDEEETEAAETIPEIQPEEIPTESPEAIPEGENWTVGQIIFLIACIASAAALLAGAVLLLLRLSRTYGWNFPPRSRQSRLLGVFQAFYRRMCKLGLPKNTDSQSDAFAAFCVQQLQCRDTAAAESFPPAMQHLFASCFGVESVREQNIRTMRTLLLASRKRPKKGRK